MQILKYTVHNVAHSYGKTATFMPKPIVGDNGSGMHVHQSLWKGGKNLFAGNGYAGLSELRAVLHRRHHQARQALNAITNPGTNSYKRLVPGFEAPVNLAYSARNRRPRSVSRCGEPEGAPHRGAFPGSDRQPLSGFAALMMAGLDGVQNKIHPGDPSTRTLRPAAGRGHEGPECVLLAGHGAGDWTRIASS